MQNNKEFIIKIEAVLLLIKTLSFYVRFYPIQTHLFV